MEFIGDEFVTMLLLVLYVGAFAYILGLFVFLILVWRLKVSLAKIALFSLIQVMASIFLSFLFFNFWPFEMEAFRDLLLPSFIAELVVIPVLYFILRKNQVS